MGWARASICRLTARSGKGEEMTIGTQKTGRESAKRSGRGGQPSQQLMAECLQLCQDCVRICWECSAHCYKTGSKDMADAVEVCIDCAEFGNACISCLARGSTHTAQMCEACADICDACAETCAKGSSEIMRRCADVCRRTAEACRKLAV